ncbi:MAG: LTA synthase family protein [Planctomycetes bacterium]|nr:LTA synthase family protein [Planctomycetota bacterium]
MLFPPNIRLVFWLYAFLLVLFQLLRACLYVRNRDLADGASAAAIAGAFVVGLRFDLAIAAYVTMPVLIISKLARLKWGSGTERRVIALWFSAFGVIFVLMGLGELEFYREFYSRFNMLAIEYWSHPGTVGSMIWHGYPVVRYTLVGSGLCAAYILAVVWLERSWRPQAGLSSRSAHLANGAWLVLGMGLLVLAARGGIRGTPLEWGDAIHSDSTFANHLAQNGFWTLGRALHSHVSSKRVGKNWLNAMPGDEARQAVQRLLLLPNEALVSDRAQFPLLRQSHEGNRSVSGSAVSADPPNVVVIIMESFSGRYVGALGSDNDRTPEYNRLAQNGILFDRCFSNGSHTHQAIYAVGTSFPNLPGYECLMETALASQRFDSLPGTLKRRGYSTMFLYNGDFAWDNMQGFFRIQGMDRFVGRDDFDKTGYFDSTWGVSDKELFERANQEFAKTKAPFYATILTLSNHAPFELPKPLPFPEVTDAGEWNSRMNGIRFADWAIGHFFDLARRESYFRNTLFVLVGDHGFSVPPILTELNLLRFHVPLLFYSPGLLGEQGRRRHMVASHVDIEPTILGLLGENEPHQHWGRDLFTLPEDDPGFAVFKPSSGGNEVGFARGDMLLVETEGGKKTLYRYDVGFPPSVVELNPADRELFQQMAKDLHAYIQTALDVLTQHHVAP